ncbi:hypothetical protein D0860_04657 [Hortaea werneckii]|uniref:EXPERA domain-containing protein n=1 Tax=Hortaea werneckii TaxID=91943 RepID=A0A3M7H513_HORWE|nr:hypothetical protein KC351_g2642 [Hortaea werneckii]RMZ08490.1 hypothetical protein D0860_04657 [Hortaea werneckii]
MVATRNHPKDFDAPPTESPTKRSTRADTANTRDSPSQRPSTTSKSTATTTPTNHVAATSPTRLTSPTPRTTSTATKRPSSPTPWSHTPSNLTLLWLAISLPLVIWDTGYVVLRPHSMPGGALHAPLWTPYALYGTIDYMYGFKQWDAHNGFTLAQGSFNAVETVAYGVYLYLVYRYGREEEGRTGRGAPRKEFLGRLRALGKSRTVEGRLAVWVVLLGYSTAFLTFTKTVLYWLNEVFSGFENIGHNSWSSLFFLWIVPNGAWLVLPAYMIYVFGQEIIQGLLIATDGGKKSR